jgi:hypothetical protein
MPVYPWAMSAALRKFVAGLRACFRTATDPYVATVETLAWDVAERHVGGPSHAGRRRQQVLRDHHLSPRFQPRRNGSRGA